MIQRFDPRSDGWGSPSAETVLIGPPGTGKTRAVLDAWLVPALRGLRPNEVLACSFTTAAAGEMRGRLAKASGRDERDLRNVCRTIHSEAYRLVRAQGGPSVIWRDSMAPAAKSLAATPKPDEEQPLLAVQGDEEQDVEVRWERMAEPCTELHAEALRVWALACNLYPDDAGKMELLVERVLRRQGGAGHFRSAEILSELRRYQALKQAAGALDFTDMLLLALDCDPPERQLLIVDEAQDLSPLQVRLIERWQQRSAHLVWVGDPDQGIYAFAGADGHHLTGLIRGGVATVRSLQQSYRVPAAPLDLARSVILRNRDRVDAPYLPSGDAGAVYEVSELAHAIAFVAEMRVEAAAPEQRKTVFVLARSARVLGEYAVELTRAGVPYSNERGGSALRKQGLIAALLAIHSLVQRLRITVGQAKALLKIIPGRPRWPLLRVKKVDAERSLKAVEEGVLLDALPGVDTSALQALGGEEAVLRSLGEGRLEEAEPLLRIAATEGWEALTRPPAVTLTTVHGSKGREADSVLLDCGAPWPTRQAIERGAPGISEEERRLLYVGITRTRDSLCLLRKDPDLYSITCGGR